MSIMPDAKWIERVSLGLANFLGGSLSSKKQNSVVLSTVEAEYVIAGSCCAQLLWMR
jgi:hypothetical protein